MEERWREAGKERGRKERDHPYKPPIPPLQGVCTSWLYRWDVICRCHRANVSTSPRLPPYPHLHQFMERHQGDTLTLGQNSLCL